MAVDGSLNFDTKIDASGFNKGTKYISSSLNNIKSGLVKVGAAVGVAFGVKSLIDFGKKAIDTASDITEVQNVVDVAFGSMKYKMEDFADTAIEKFGISKLAAKQTGSTFMAMAAGMGLAAEEASDMSIKLTGLSADMSSFYNKSQSETFTALQSVFTGETETLKQYGIVMTQANLQAFAYSQGIEKKISAMTQAEQVQLRYNYVLSQTSLAQGDFARTSGSWANQVRILKEQWNEFSGTAGTVLMNVLLPVVRSLNSAMSQLVAFAGKALSALSSLFGWEIQQSGSAASAVTGITNELNAATDSQNALTEAGEATAKANEKQLAGFDKINKLSENTSGESGGGSEASVGGVSGGSNTVDIGFNVDTSAAESKIKGFINSVRTSVEAVKQWFKTNFSSLFSGIWNGLTEEAQELKGTLTGVFNDLKSLADPLKSYFNSDFTPFLKSSFSALGTVATGLFDTFNKVFGDLWNMVLFPFISSCITVLLPMFTQIYTSVVSTFETLFSEVKVIFDMLWQQAIAPALAVITSIWTDFTTSLKEAWDKWGKPIFDNIKTAIESTSSALQNLWKNYLQPVWNSIVEAVQDIWTNNLKPFVDNFLDFVGEIINGGLEIYNKFILPVVNWFVNKFGPPISNIFTTVVNVIKTAVGNIINVVSGIITSLKGIVQFITGVFTGDWEKAWTGIKNFFGGVWDSLAALVKMPVETIKVIVNALKEWITEKWQNIKDDLSEIPDWFRDKFETALTFIKSVFSTEKIKSHFNSILSGIKDIFSGIPDWFKQKFSAAWQNVKNVFSSGGQVFNGIKEGILSSLKSVINGLIGGINNVIAIPFKGINTALSKIRDISIGSIQPFKNLISLINVPSIPKLATGTVVPANYGEFLAVLGDNKRETEVVSPLSTIKQALLEVLGSQSGGDINLTIELDGDVVYKTIVRKNRQNTRLTGVNALGY